VPSTLLNDTFLRALQRQPTDYTPIWLMRQAGRYLPEYNATRSRAGSFLGLATNPDYATEVTLQPLERFPLDAAILFSDILTIPDAMGLGLNFVQGEGPRFERTVRTEEDVAKLHVPDIDATLRYVTDAVSQIRRELTDAQGRQKVPLIGFSGSPWTLACYMIEGSASAELRKRATSALRPGARSSISDWMPSFSRMCARYFAMACSLPGGLVVLVRIISISQPWASFASVVVSPIGEGLLIATAGD